MTVPHGEFNRVNLSLADLVGGDYIQSVCEARSVLSGEDCRELVSTATTPIDFYPTEFQARLLRLLPKVGTKILQNPYQGSPKGATTQKFAAVTKTEMAPLSGFGFFRVSETGKVHLTTKCEHYHAPLGHNFPGYRLLEQARNLGIPNATHNNTRGAITRKLEEELVCAANGIDAGKGSELSRILESEKPNTINRVLNLETGSLAVEAALKMILARFYRPQGESPQPEYEGFTPVILVVGNEDGGLHANYHGTTLLTQVLRGMWPEFAEGLDKTNLFRVRAIRPNNLEDLESAFQNAGDGKHKLAGFFHEIVMMNYGARLLTRDFLKRAYDLCEEHDVPTVVDEIQSCMWAPGFFLYREYGLAPTFVAVGKGFPGGEFPASRILFSSEMDNLPQFGALVTNGQEELASLAYLITMAWAKANTEITREVGDYYEERLGELANKHTGRILGTDGNRHMTSLCFHDLESAKSFVGRLVEKGLDISVQTYKEDCPPVVLTKIPLTTTPEVVDFIVERMNEAMHGS